MSNYRPDAFDDIVKPKSEITNSQVMKVLAFIIVVIPLLVPLNFLLWRLALGA